MAPLPLVLRLLHLGEVSVEVVALVVVALVLLVHLVDLGIPLVVELVHCHAGDRGLLLLREELVVRHRLRLSLASESVARTLVVEAGVASGLGGSGVEMLQLFFLLGKQLVVGVDFRIYFSQVQLVRVLRRVLSLVEGSLASQPKQVAHGLLLLS